MMEGKNKEKDEIVLLMTDSQLEKLKKVWRGEIITFGKFKVITRELKNEGEQSVSPTGTPGQQG